jgi:phage baseplate assembly protein W
MIDMQLQNQCDHKIYELITISGVSPNYYTYLENIPNKTRNGVYVGCYTTDTDLESFALQGFNVVGGSNSLVGITNWEFDDNEPTKINFPYNAEIPSVDGNKDILPKLMYVMSYYTTIANCPKCNGTGIVSDIAFDNVGKLKTVTGYGKVKQQLLKILLTVIGDNLYDSDYGSQINNSIGQKFTTYTSANIQYSIYKAVQHLMKIQQENNLPANETIAELSNITVEPTSDPRKLKLSINVITADAQEVSSGLTFNLQ